MNRTGLRSSGFALLSAFIWLTAIGGGLSVPAQPSLARMQFDHWTVEDGLPQGSVAAITQTRDGYLWLATSGGLVRFDGARFKVFSRSDYPGIASTRFHSLLEDSRGALWIGAASGILVRYLNGVFTSFSTENGLPMDDFVYIEEDAEGYLWLNGRHSSITRWRDGESRIYSPKDILPGRLRPTGPQDAVWWSVDETRLHVYTRGQHLSWTRQDGLPTLDILAVNINQYGTIWVTTRGGLVRIGNGRVRTYKVADGLYGNSLGGYVGEDRQGRFWFSGEFVLLMSDGSTAIIRTIKPDGGIFYEDREGTMWIGSAEGLHRVREPGIAMVAPRQGHPTDWTYSILESRVGDIWLGMWGGGLFRWRNGRSIQYLPDTHPGLYSGRITSLYEDRAGRIWVGNDGGVSLVESEALKRFPGRPELKDTWAMHEDRDGNFWFGTTTGLVRYSQGGWQVYTKKDGLPHDRINAILETRDGALWFGAEEGVARWQAGRFTSYTSADGLAGGQIRCLYEDADGVLWIGGYDGGLTRFKGGRLTRYTTREGLYDNGVFQILEDDRGYFWIGCNRGIYRVSRALLNDFAEGRTGAITSAYFGKQDGMLDLECNGGRQPAGWKTRDGRLWFPTMAGAAIVDPAKFPINTVPPGVGIEECRVNQEKTGFGSGLTLEPGQDYLEIDYTGISFIRNEQVKFRYRMIGWDKDWVEAGARRTAYYNHVAPGEYSFTVIAANSDGVWNTEGRSLRVVVTPPFWLTGWFIALLVLSLAGTAGAVYWVRVSRLRREHVLREEFQARERAVREKLLRQREVFQSRERAAQEALLRQVITSQESERHRIAGELHDGLKNDLIIMGESATHASHNPEDAVGELKELKEKADQAIESINCIINDLRPPILAAGLTDALNSIVAAAIRTSGITVTDEIEDVNGVLPERDEIHLYRIVQESVANILKHAQATEARVCARKVNTHLLIEIQDNGCGFDPLATLSERAQGRGFGLTSVARRVEILGGEQSIVSMPGKGTLITIRLNVAGGIR